MRQLLISLICSIAFLISGFAQNHDTYTVEKGDTVTYLAIKFDTTKEAILKLNPDATGTLKVGAVLVMPSKTKEDSTQQRTPKTFKTVKVKRKQTLWSISQEYDVSIDEIKRYNTWLYSEPLKRKDKVRVPIYPEVKLPDAQTSEDTELVINEIPVATVTVKEKSPATHVVKAKEGKFGISRKYGMTIPELEALNPDMKEPLQPGQILKVKGNPTNQETVITDDRFMFYEVKPKENFFRLEQRFNVSEDSLIALNPKLEDGLKAGMVIKIPKKEIAVFSEANTTTLENRLFNFENRTVALMLPFNTHKIDVDSISTSRERIKDDRVMRISLDFYSGALMAVEDAKQNGLSTTLKVFDTEQSKSKVASIINSNDFDDVDLVIGPLLNSTVEEASSRLRRRKTPVVSPLSNKRNNGGFNLIQSRPTQELLHKTMLRYIDSMHTSQNIVIVADSKSANLKRMLLNTFPFASVLEPREENFLYETDVRDEIIDGKENWFIIATDDVALLSNVTSYLNAFSFNHNIQMFALEKTDAFENQDVSNAHLSQLKFTFPSVDRAFDIENPAGFVSSYKAKHGIVPNKYAVRGYDITYDILLRMGSYDSIFTSMDKDIVTEYVENKFNYMQNGTSGYYNLGIYIMQYGEGLSLKTVSYDQ